MGWCLWGGVGSRRGKLARQSECWHVSMACGWLVSVLFGWLAVGVVSVGFMGV